MVPLTFGAVVHPLKVVKVVELFFSQAERAGADGGLKKKSSKSSCFEKSLVFLVNINQFDYFLWKTNGFSYKLDVELFFPWEREGGGEIIGEKLIK